MSVFRFLQTATIALLSSGAAALSAQDPGVVDVSGHILDALSKAPVAQVEVALVGTDARASSGPDGSFMLRGVAPGVYVLQAKRLGYEDLRREDVRVGEGSVSTLDLVMTPAALSLDELIVTPGSFSFMGTGASARQTMSRQEIESVPQFAEDIFRAVNRLPGLTSGDFSAHFSVRGGRPDETLILLDGLEIYEPYHLKDFNDGAISIIDVETIGGVDLLTGGFPAKYGNRTSGIFGITSREPQTEDTRYSFGLSLVNARAMAEGRFAEDKGSWFVSGRRGYLDLVLDILNQNDLPSPSYYDVFAKARYEASPNHSLSVNLLHARDHYTFDAASTTGFRDTIDTRETADNKYGNSYGWLGLTSLLGDRVAVNTIASAGLITASRGGTEFYVSTSDPQYAITNNRDFYVFGLKQDWAVEWSETVHTELGFDVRSQDAEYDISNFVGPDPDNLGPDSLTHYPVETRSTEKRNGTTVGTYLSNRFRIFDPLVVELGVRYDRGSHTGDSDVTPRVGALLRLAGRSSLRFGWGHYRQMQGIAELSVLDGQNDYFPSELSKQWTLGFEHRFDAGGLFRVEAYHKRGDDLRPVYRNWKGGLDTFPETNEDRILVYPDSMTSKGIELYLQRQINERLSIRGSYAMAAVDEHTPVIENINDPTPLVFEPTHSGPQDQRHTVNLDLTYRLADSWSVNTSYAFHTGWPATLESMQKITNGEGQTDFVIKPQTVYGSRFPNYHRIDVRATRRVRTSRGELRFFVEVNNLTNHQNVFGYDYFRELDSNGSMVLQQDIETGIIILPSLGVSWSGILF